MSATVNVLLNASNCNYKIKIESSLGRLVTSKQLIETIKSKYHKLVEFLDDSKYDLEIFDEDFNSYVTLNDCDEIENLSRLRAKKKAHADSESMPGNPKMTPTPKSKSKAKPARKSKSDSIKENISTNRMPSEDLTVSEAHQNQLLFLSCVKDAISNHPKLQGKAFWNKVQSLIEDRGYMVLDLNALPSYWNTFVDVYVKVLQECSTVKEAVSAWAVFGIMHNLDLRSILKDRDDYAAAIAAFNQSSQSVRNSIPKASRKTRKKRKRKSKKQ